MCWPRLASARSGGDSRFFAALLLASVLGCVLFGSGRARAAERLLMVAVDVRGVDDATFRRFGVLALTRKIALRLTQSGFAVVAPERRPHVRVSLAPAGRRRVTLRAEARRVAAATREVARGRERLEDFHLTAVHKAVAAVREVAARYRAMLAKLPREQLGEGEVPPALRLAPVVRRTRGRWGFSLGVVGAALMRAGGVDYQARLPARFGARASGVAFYAAPFVALPLSGAEAIKVVEWGVQAGIGYGFVFGRWRLELSLLAGVSLHHFSLDDRGASSSSSSPAVDFVLDAPLELSRYVGGKMRLGLWAAPGLTHRGRTHQLDASRVLYERSAARATVGVSVRYGSVL